MTFVLLISYYYCLVAATMPGAAAGALSSTRPRAVAWGILGVCGVALLVGLVLGHGPQRQRQVAYGAGEALVPASISSTASIGAGDTGMNPGSEPAVHSGRPKSLVCRSEPSQRHSRCHLNAAHAEQSGNGAVAAPVIDPEYESMARNPTSSFLPSFASLFDPTKATTIAGATPGSGALGSSMLGLKSCFPKTGAELVRACVA